jgi:hypothetical protein
MDYKKVIDPATGREILVQPSNRGDARVAPYEPIPSPSAPIRGTPEYLRAVEDETRVRAQVASEGTSDRTSAATVNKIAEGVGQLDKIQRARDAVKARPESVGLKRGVALLPGMGKLGSVVNQNLDPEGVDARRLIADVGSMEIKDRSGAAVTVSEFPRLAPFIPMEYDSPDKVLGDLENLERELRVVLDALANGANLADLSPGKTPTPTRRPLAPGAARPSYAEWKASQGRAP